VKNGFGKLLIGKLFVGKLLVGLFLDTAVLNISDIPQKAKSQRLPLTSNYLT
jgi:hypothetical protein